MRECILTLDYEIYGNGTGSLRELVLQPTRRLSDLCRRHGACLVVFPDALELARIEAAGSDPDAASVPVQLRELREAGHEIGLHLHPWWANARHEGGRWRLDWSERNICRLEPQRVDAIVSAAIRYLREALDDPGFTPLSFRSALWIMQPSAVIADVLARQGVRVDSSVFRGGRVRGVGLDYRGAPANRAAWRFGADVVLPDPGGALWEVPIHTEMVPFWRMLGRKRRALHTRVPGGSAGTPLPRRWRDYVRARYPRKLDFCRMTFEEMRDAFEKAFREGPGGLGAADPVVAIGHSKDLVDFDAIGLLLDFLKQKGARVTTFSRVLSQQLASC